MTNRLYGCPRTEMEIEEADSVFNTGSCYEVQVSVMPRAGGGGGAVKRRIVESDFLEDNEYIRTTGTQTEGHVFIGESGLTIITTNYALVKLVIDNGVVNELMGAADVDRVTDIVTKSLARLEWNGEKILAKALTSYRLTLTNDLMPRLLKQLAELVRTETDHHRVQRLARVLLEEHLVKLFGIDVSSVVFILDEGAAATTPGLTERREELQRVLLGLLPDWVSSVAVWTTEAYNPTPQDGAEHFGFEDFWEVPLAAWTDLAERSGSGTVPAPEPPSRLLVVGADADPASSRTLQAGSGSVRDEDSLHLPGLVGEPAQGEVLTSSEERRPSTSYQSAAPLEEEPGPSTSYQSATPSEKEGSLEGERTAEVRRTTGEDAERRTVTGVAEEEEEEEDPLGGEAVLQLEDIDTDDIPKQEVDLRLVVLGKTGGGKSSVANSILGQEAFPVAATFRSVTTECQLFTATRQGLTIEILDTPGLGSSTVTTQQVYNMVLTAVSRMEDGPDALLYVIRIGTRYGQEEFDDFNLLKMLLDDNITNYIIVVFTHGDLLEGQGVEDLLKNPETLITVMMRQCGNRYVVFDNTADDQTPQVDRLLAEIRELTQRNAGQRYRCPRYAENLDEIDRGLELRLMKAEQQRLSGRAYVQTLRTRLRETEEQMRRNAQEFARLEDARKAALKEKEEKTEGEIARLAEALQRGQAEEEERKEEILALRDEMAAEDKRARREMEEMQRRELALWKRRDEEMRRYAEKLKADRVEAERAAAERRAQEMARLKAEVARSRRRKKNACAVM